MSFLHFTCRFIHGLMPTVIRRPTLLLRANIYIFEDRGKTRWWSWNASVALLFSLSLSRLTPSISAGKATADCSRLSRYVGHPSPRINYVTAVAAAASTSPRATLPALLIILPSFLPSFPLALVAHSFSLSLSGTASHSVRTAHFRRCFPPRFPSAFRRCVSNLSTRDHAFVRGSTTCFATHVADETTSREPSTRDDSSRARVSVLKFLRFFVHCNI